MHRIILFLLIFSFDSNFSNLLFAQIPVEPIWRTSIGSEAPTSRDETTHTLRDNSSNLIIEGSVERAFTFGYIRTDVTHRTNFALFFASQKRCTRKKAYQTEVNFEWQSHSKLTSVLKGYLKYAFCAKAQNSAKYAACVTSVRIQKISTSGRQSIPTIT